MAGDRSFTLTEIARRLEVPQHRLIHLCEKGVVVPDVHGAAGRGSSRVFSPRNFLELAVALRLRDMTLPVATVGAVIHVLRAFEERLREDLPHFALADSLREDRAPDLRVIISDGQTIYFSLGAAGTQPKLFGGIRLEQLEGEAPEWDGRIEALRFRGNARNQAGGLGPEHSHYGRLELSLTAIAQALPID
ncbi:MAG TPA: MerR family transcriptional regulator [Solirubrobacteraceae bacterium]|nr:MerR family transcriptional regulator [Solirubrobacteraceae bacterium]